MNMTISNLGRYGDRLIVFSYLVFFAAIGLVYPAKTVEFAVETRVFNNCSGEWQNALAVQNVPDVAEEDFAQTDLLMTSSTVWQNGFSSIECSQISTSTQSIAITSGKIHIKGVAKKNISAEPLIISAAAVEDVEEIVPETIQDLIVPSIEEAVTSTEAVPVVEDLVIVSQSPEIVAEQIVENPKEVTLEQIGFVRVDYIIEGGEWKTAGIIGGDLEREVVFDIENITSEELSSLRVRLTGMVESSDTTVYVDSVWVVVDGRVEEGEAVIVDPIAAIADAQTVSQEVSPKSDKLPPEPFIGEIIENPAIPAEPLVDIFIDPEATHSCSSAAYHVTLHRGIAEPASVDILLDGPSSLSSSTLHVVSIPKGLSFSFENNLDEYAVNPEQTSATLHVSVLGEIESRSLNVPIVYSRIRADNAKSDVICQINVIVE